MHLIHYRIHYIGSPLAQAIGLKTVKATKTGNLTVSLTVRSGYRERESWIQVPVLRPVSIQSSNPWSL